MVERWGVLKKAREHLGTLIFKQNVTVDVNDQDRWGRYIARVATEDGRDVGNEMIQAGLAWHYKHFDKSEAYAQAEQTARDNKRGLWSDPGAVAPWEFRKRRP